MQVGEPWKALNQRMYNRFEIAGQLIARSIAAWVALDPYPHAVGCPAVLLEVP